VHVDGGWDLGLSASSKTACRGLAPLRDYARETAALNRRGTKLTARTVVESTRGIVRFRRSCLASRTGGGFPSFGWVGNFVGECYKVVHVKRFVVALLMFTLLAVSCSTEASTVSDLAVSTSRQRPPAPKPVAHTGATLDLMRVGGQKIAVTLMRVIDPATVPVGWGDAGKTYIATQLKITNTGKSTIVGNSNSDVSVVGSDNQDYSADFATVTECKDFAYGWFLLAAGSSTTGCVVFALPHGVTAVKVKYVPSSGISHDVGEWLNP
jgi:uncharacterized protein DUF4352